MRASLFFQELPKCSIIATGMVSALDESTGQVVKALEKKGMLSDSMIIFVSDNGAMTHGSQPNEGSNFPYRGVRQR